DRATCRHGVTRIRHELEKDELELRAIDLDRTRIGSDIGGEQDTLADQALEEGLELLNDRAEMDDLGAKQLPATEGEQVSHESRALGCLLANLIEIVARPAV